MKARLPYAVTTIVCVVTLVCRFCSAQKQLVGSEWPVYGGSNANAKYSPLGQINAANAKNLKVAWRWKSPDADILKAKKGMRTWLNEGTPIMVGGVLYVSTSLSQVAAIDAATGKTIWTYDPEAYKTGVPPNLGFTHRGVAYWGGGGSPRIFIGTGNAYLIALDARTGALITDFGENGKIDLTKGLGRSVVRALYGVSSPPLVIKDTVVVGSSILDFPIVKEMPPGDVRGFDAATGKLKWSFQTVPRDGGEGAETWEDGSHKTTGSANVWTIMSADESLGYVYLPCSTPSNDWYGGKRLGSGLYGECLVCLNAETGKRIWHYQFVHHGVWDYDLPAAPNLCDINVNGQKIKAVAQVTKQGFCYVFDRVTGKPVWPIEERPVPQSTVKGEKTWPTQPFPTKPPAYDRQGVKTEDLINFNPKMREDAGEFISKYDHGPLFTPPTERGTVYVPGWGGGANWAGAAFDPETGMLYVPSITGPITVKIGKPPAGLEFAGMVGTPTPIVDTPNGLPLFKPPYGRITAIDLNKGTHAWMTPLGDGPRNHPLLRSLKLGKLGWPRRGFVLATKSLLFAGQETGEIGRGAQSAEKGHTLDVNFVREEKLLTVFDKRSGNLICEINLPSTASGALMTYAVKGKQFVVVPIGGGDIAAELVALSLP